MPASGLSRRSHAASQYTTAHPPWRAWPHERGLNLNNVGLIGGDVIVAGYREICEVLFPQPVSADEVRLRHVVIPLYLQLISPPNGLQEMLPAGA
jgi:hypothetical protein